MNIQKHIGGLFIALIAFVSINPSAINDMYNSILGRFILLSIVIFFSMNHITLGLLVALIIIMTSNYFSSLVEGMNIIGEDNISREQKVLTKLESDSSKQTEDNTTGIDKEDIKTAIMSKSSKQIPVDSSMNTSASGEVYASTTSMLKPSSMEGFISFSKY